MRKTVARLLAEPLDHLVIVENGSSDGTREWLASLDDPRLDVIEMSHNGGGALGFETGMRHATSKFDPDWMVLMDDDARPQPGAFARFREGADRRDWGVADALAAAVYFPDGQICEMNRPWVNPFASWRVFLRVLSGGGRAAFHIPDDAFTTAGPRRLDGTSFVGFFISRQGVANAGYPDGRLFIYGDDVLYTLAMTQGGGQLMFAPGIIFEHECSTQQAGAMMRPLWKGYYHHRNLWFVYRRTAGAVIFPLLMAVMLPKWLAKGGALPKVERAHFRRLVRLAIADAFRGNLSRSHAEIVARSTGEWAEKG